MGMSGWEETFYPEYIEPIEEFKEAIEKAFVTGIPEIEEGSEIKPPKKQSCSVQVLSNDHGSGIEGKYFNFDKKQLDAILGRTDWSNERLKVSNGKEVIVWRNPNGGSKGDAHGRWDEDPKPFQFWIGQKVTFVDAHCAAVDCADNYFPQNGDVAGWGEVDGAGNGQKVGNCDECAKLCTERGACKSYECSGSELRCNLNEGANPTKKAHTDYAFCTKMTVGGCGANYYEQDGDVAGWGVVNGAGGGQHVAACGECARLCTDRAACKSYECGGGAELRCNLNAMADPNKEKSERHQDYLFCTKMPDW